MLQESIQSVFPAVRHLEIVTREMSTLLDHYEMRSEARNLRCAAQNGMSTCFIRKRGASKKKKQDELRRDLESIDSMFEFNAA